MNVHKNLYSLLTLIICILSFSCKNFNELYDEALVNSSKEQNKFLILKKDINKRGNKGINSVSNWIKSFSEFNKTTTKIKNLMKEATDEQKKEFVYKLQTLKAVFNHKSNRDNYEYSNILVPSWSSKNLSDLSNSIKKELLIFKENYHAIFNENIRFESKVLFSFKIDESLLDTYPLCIKKLKSLKDQTCSSIAEERCDHQVDLNCIDRLIKINDYKCSVWKQVREFGDVADTSHGVIINKKETLNWPEKIKTQCQNENRLILNDK